MRAIIMALIFTMTAHAYQPTAENLQAREWFQDSKFGLFIHWGVYSVLGEGEWVMQKNRMTVTGYERLAPQFNPQKFDAAAWVAMAKDAGMKYITITARHHDGFSMWPTEQNDWNIVDATPYKRDPLKQLARECRRQDIGLFFYYSQLDWHHSDYFPLGATGQWTSRQKKGKFDRYLDFMNAQLSELLTRYGDIKGIWFDGMWDKPHANWQLARTYDLIHRLQPAALVGSNHHLKPFEGEDFQMFEKDLPGKNTKGFSANSVIGSLPLETCETINHSWGFDKRDQEFKSSEQLIQYLVKAAGNNANFLLNVGPRPNGMIQPKCRELLHEMGEWLRKYGDSIYGTRGGPIEQRDWGVTTQKGSDIYLHILDLDGEELVIPKIENVLSAKIWPGGQDVEMEERGSDFVLKVPMSIRDPIDTIIKFEINQP